MAYNPPPTTCSLHAFIYKHANIINKYNFKSDQRSDADIASEIANELKALKKRRETASLNFVDFDFDCDFDRNRSITKDAYTTTEHLSDCIRAHCICRSIGEKGLLHKWPCLIPCDRHINPTVQIQDPKCQPDYLQYHKKKLEAQLDCIHVDLAKCPKDRSFSTQPFNFVAAQDRLGQRFKRYHNNTLQDNPPIGVTDPIAIRSLGFRNYIRNTMSSSSGAPESWISSFCSLLGHEYFAEISEDFIEDDFNLTGLQTQVAMYKEALEVRYLDHYTQHD